MSSRSALFAVLFVLLSSVFAGQVHAQPPPRFDECARDGLISFRTEDDVEVSGLLLGSGANGVLLATDGITSACGWLPLARQLADDGYQVLVTEGRKPDATSRNYGRFDLDAVAAAQELQRRGASSIVAAGANRMASAIAVNTRKMPGLRSVVLLSPLWAFAPGFQRELWSGVPGEVESVDLPMLVVAAENDGVVSDREDAWHAPEHARAIVEAASRGELEIVPGKETGGDLVKDEGPARQKVLAFVRETSPPASFTARWGLPIAVAGVAVLLVGAFVLYLRHRRTT